MLGSKSSAALAFRLKTDIRLLRNCILARRFPAALLEPRPEFDAFWSRGACACALALVLILVLARARASASAGLSASASDFVSAHPRQPEQSCCQISVLGNCGAVPAGGTEARHKYLKARGKATQRNAT
ncbi:uncharacterized protein GLRG_04199 [Colletotrichum graminicola M1.001]|uniref:Uncharacterized protein n=1 Tax=Colletotrichum graminicola (strain M1.001 / M2 / FGSC 10212) TaxID=645133 RepID=E3QDW7_COLGM|nr:uncharacterized protein GLRG_04199 [Colletotrichum graminicola M1.001]EFQ29055.1 hypothetical protein GLRG_04199 [Colletotrichum graminicola M1.001]